MWYINLLFYTFMQAYEVCCYWFVFIYELFLSDIMKFVIYTEYLSHLYPSNWLYCSAVSGEDAQDRSDRTILTPWVKFLWESYCQCLELLRTNAHVETLYHDIARMVSLHKRPYIMW